MLVPDHSDLFLLLRQFCSLVPPIALFFPDHLPASDVHDFLVDSILLHPHLQQYPPSKQYQKSFWKWCISHLETKDVEISPFILDNYMSLLTPAGPYVLNTFRSTAFFMRIPGVPAIPHRPCEMKYVLEGSPC